MKKILLVTVFLLISISAFCTSHLLNKSSESRVEINYIGLSFSVPNQHKLIGVIPEGNDLLVLRYSNEKSQQYIGFTSETNQLFAHYQCELKEFYQDAFTANKNSNCNKQELDAFNKVFLSGNEYGVWKNDSFNSYYLSKENKSFLYVIHNEKVIRIESDFLSLEEFKKLIQQYL